MIKEIQANPLHVRRLSREALLNSLDIHDPLVKEGWDHHPNPAIANKWADRYDAVAARMAEGALHNLGRPQLPPVPSRWAILPGKSWNKSFAYDLRHSNRHGTMVGDSGSGKSTQIKILLIQYLARGIRGRMDEFATDGRKFVRLIPNSIVLRTNQLPIAILNPVGRPEQYFSGLCQLLGWFLGAHVSTPAHAARLLLELYHGRNAGERFMSLRDFAEFLRRTAGRDQKLLTLLAGLDSLNEVLGETSYIREAPENWEEQFPLTIVEWHGYPPRLYALLTSILLFRVRLAALARPTEGIRLVWVFDEAHHIFQVESTSQFTAPHEEIYREFRKFGICLLAATQIPSMLPKAVLSNSAIWFCFKLPDPAEVRPVLERLGLPPSFAPMVTKFGPGQGLFFGPGLSSAIPFEAFNVEPEVAPSDHEIDELMKPRLERLRQQCVYSPLKDRPSTGRDWKAVIGERAKAETARDVVDPIPPSPEPDTEAPPSDPVPTPLQDFHAIADEIHRHPQASKSEHYKNLGWGGAKGKRVLQAMLNDGLIRVAKTPTEGRPREILQFTEKGQEVFPA